MYPQDINKPLTVKDLKKYLKDFEEAWTDQDKEVLGNFDDVSITCAGIGQGFCKAGVSFAYCDIMFFSLDESFK